MCVNTPLCADRESVQGVYGGGVSVRRGMGFGEWK